MVKLFGTDGIRSEINLWPLTPDFAVKIGQAAARVLARSSYNPRAIIGRDPRLSGHMLEHALATGITSHGIEAILTGVVPTPGLAYLTRTKGAQFGVMISASHNPFDHNGIKFFGADGFKIPDEAEEEMEHLLLTGDGALDPVGPAKLGESRYVNWQQDYAHHLVTTWEERYSLEGMRLVIDCADGATAAIAPNVFGRLGAEIILHHCSPDGLNINQHYEYIYPHELADIVKEEEADAGIAFDGDGDRVMLVDEKGGFVNGDAILAILARHLQQQEMLKGSVVVSTPMSNLGLRAALEEVNLSVEEVRVGDRFVLQRMRDMGYGLGGEQSGHILIMRDGQTTGDGIYTALAVLEAVMAQDDRSLAALADCFCELPECLVNIDVSHKPPLEELPEIQAALEELEHTFGDRVDINLRYSGTESKLRLKIRATEALEQQLLETHAYRFAATARKIIG
ncbi:MAG: phosphoglucosamine mutase [Anaerolineae bacterium]